MTEKKEILFVTPFTPRGGKVAQYSQELIQTMRETFEDSFSINVCALESGKISYNYSDLVKCKMQTGEHKQYVLTAEDINKNDRINLVCIQHDFNLFGGEYGENILYFLYTLTKPIIITFHTVLERPKVICKQLVKGIATVSEKIIVMNKYDAEILKREYEIPSEKIAVIPFTDRLDIFSDSKSNLTFYQNNHFNEMQNSAIAYANMFKKTLKDKLPLKYNLNEISLAHIKRITNNAGILRHSNWSQPDINSGYSIDDNAHALIALTLHFELTKEKSDLTLIKIYLKFIESNQRSNGSFITNLDKFGNSVPDDSGEDYQVSTARTIWALGEFISRGNSFSSDLIKTAERVMEKTFSYIEDFDSPKAIAFSIKGLYHYNLTRKSPEIKQIIVSLANHLISKYHKLDNVDFEWFEDSLSFENCVLPESLLYAYLETGNEIYKTVAKISFDYLLSITIDENKIQIISNKYFYKNENNQLIFHEYPIDVSYTILALDLFYEVFSEEEYWEKLEIAFSWFNGNNYLFKVMYNHNTGGCYDELGEESVNPDESAESTVTYLIARLIIEKYIGIPEEKEAEELEFEPAISEY
ncbi:MAG: hypothetical protein A3F72_05270 [Bacteroidetes bacterium RIFCSPLOWO2_12_FULL_35_15]|nr:MAG: hypothetical protein A3F72_05270 [Bacteroidetes bacterium RIFCSPLOWO2_12_FULL_35_15]